MMPRLSATPHVWTLRFDRTVCRDCGCDERDADLPCAGAGKVRPLAGMRQQHNEERA